MSTATLSAVHYLKIPESGTPYLEGHKCNSCNTIFLGERNVCSKCAARDQIETVKLAETGTLYSYSIVFRSFPGVEVPYVSAIVDLDDGTAIKGNLINVEPNPDHIQFGMPVEVIYDDALGRKDKDGNAYLAYFFQPQSEFPALNHNLRRRKP